ncbi:hypothetical protein ABZ805_13405 [Saccharopolyspora sp. NPDC047091]|uniref:hypothetical protein n=1 Tax=Saccharopolyspora sp. NPDC047091 TaxID=3155924 RepID=UPI0033F14E0C
MPRRNRQQRPTGGQRGSSSPRPLGAGFGWSRVEEGPDGEWVVRTVPAAQATKTYRCPGCDHEVRPGVGHVVAWPADEQGDVADRRHWHSSCWQARARRGPTRRWS